MFPSKDTGSLTGLKNKNKNKIRLFNMLPTRDLLQGRRHTLKDISVK